MTAVKYDQLFYSKHNGRHRGMAEITGVGMVCKSVFWSYLTDVINASFLENLLCVCQRIPWIKLVCPTVTDQ